MSFFNFDIKQLGTKNKKQHRTTHELTPFKRDIKKTRSNR